MTHPCPPPTKPHACASVDNGGCGHLRLGRRQCRGVGQDRGDARRVGGDGVCAGAAAVCRGVCRRRAGGAGDAHRAKVGPAIQAGVYRQGKARGDG
eukprot:365185-Chlamydomonas_euryale.AAC.7